MHEDTARDLLSFIDASPTPFHAVAEARRRLLAAGFVERSEAGRFGHAPGETAFVLRGGGSLIAWRCGSQPPAEAGFRLIGAHTDSPNLRLKPRAGKAREGLLQFDVDVYGGAILASWADRDLGLAGRLMVEQEGRLASLLVRIDRPLARVPNLAIHLNREVNDKGLVLNKHQHLAPLVASWSEGGSSPEAAVAELLAGAAGVDPASLRGHDLMLFDLQPGAIGGSQGEFLFSARLDNQAMCHAALGALLGASSAPATAVIALFDHEEVGSVTSRGAEGPFLEQVLSRLAGEGIDAAPRSLARSVLVSADMAHALHPNFADLHDKEHAPRLNGGPVVKTNVNQRYATEGETAALFRSLCADTGVPCQEYVHRPDLACGSTIGPLSAARLGVRTVDVGNPMLSMHSARELGGSKDPELMQRVMLAFLSGMRI
jgi:aspartyl aminopeptidase